MNIYEIKSFYGKNLVLGKDKLDAIKRVQNAYVSAGFPTYFIHDNAVTFAKEILDGEQQKHCSNYGVCVFLDTSTRPMKSSPRKEAICTCGKRFSYIQYTPFCTSCRLERRKERGRLVTALKRELRKYEKKN